MKQDLYYIMYSSPTRCSVYVSGTMLLVDSNLSLDEAKRLIASLVSDCEDSFNQLNLNPECTQ